MIIKKIKREYFIVTSDIVVALSTIATIKPLSNGIIIHTDMGDDIVMEGKEAVEVWDFFRKEDSKLNPHKEVPKVNEEPWQRSILK